MTIEDLKNNRNRIISQIPAHYNKAEIMEMMVNMLQEDKNPTMSNIDKMVRVAKTHWLKYSSDSVSEYTTTVIDMGPENHRRAMQNAPSSMRK
jgi:DNA gyrase/topoisomerase IV subunit A